MATIELDNNAIDILNGIVKREKYETPSDAVRHLDNLTYLQSATIHKLDNKIEALEEEIERLKGSLKHNGET